MSLIYKEAPISFERATEGVIAGYANIYNERDSWGEISAPTSFVKTVSENFKQIKIYRNHDANQFIGVPKILKADDPKGLWLEAQLALHLPIAKQAFDEVEFLITNGFESGFSVGGWIIKRDSDDDRIIKEWKLQEISVLTKLQASDGSMVEIIKSVEGSVKEEEFWNAIVKAYDFRFQDDILKSLETFLTLKEKPSDDTSIVEPSTIINSIFNNFKL